jgi:3'(2'), 5'-bisphosphate nucleotidase
VTLDRDLVSPQLLDQLTAIVARAGSEVMALRGPSLSARAKPDASPVTAADEASQQVLLDGLARLMPGVAVISEESAPASLAQASTFVLIDPVDGTRELLANRDEFTVNLAVITDGTPVLGVVGAPALQLVWRGLSERGAERLRLSNDLKSGRSEPIRTRKWPVAPALAMVSRSHLDPATQAFLAGMPNVEQIGCGSALKFCRVAEGSADIYPRLAPTHEWDVAAGDAVLRAAGGTIRTPDGKPLVYGRADADFLIPAFIAWGDPERAL